MVLVPTPGSVVLLPILPSFTHEMSFVFTDKYVGYQKNDMKP